MPIVCCVIRQRNWWYNMHKVCILMWIVMWKTRHCDTKWPHIISCIIQVKGNICWFVYSLHNVEYPSMVDPQWNIWYWGSKWNLHTVCWSAVGCEWGTTSVYFGITYVCLIPSRLPVFAVEPQCLLQYFFIFVKSIIWITHTQSSKNFMLV